MVFTHCCQFITYIGTYDITQLTAENVEAAIKAKKVLLTKKNAMIG